MRKHKILTIIIAVAMLSIAVFLRWPAIVEWWMWSHAVPAENVRHAIRGLHTSEVASVVLDAGPMPGGVVVKDRKTVKLLLQGLKNAKVPEPLYFDRTDSVALKLKNGRSVGPFVFNLEHRIDAFSPEFIKGLKAAGLNAGTHP